MKGYERRACGKLVYYKLSTWDSVSCCWVDGKRQYDNRVDAIAAAKKRGRYRVSEVVDNEGRKDCEVFDVP